jgi:3-carboxy-cis,cis-muconate cycloisomerase
METQRALMKELDWARPISPGAHGGDKAETGAFSASWAGLCKTADVKLAMVTRSPRCTSRSRWPRSSSTMPQRNRIPAAIHAAVSVVRQHAAALMDAMVADHERHNPEIEGSCCRRRSA